MVGKVGRAGLVGAVVLAVAGCATHGAVWGPEPSASVTTANPGWEKRFEIEYQADPVGVDGTRVWGYLHNTYGDTFTDVRLLVQALDPGGQLVGQRLTWMGRHVPPYSRTYFDAGTLPAAHQYRVTVWSFSPLQSPPGRWPG